MESVRLAGISVDVDSVSSHLEGYGFPRPDDDGAAYSRAIPRALDVFAATGTHATFFLIANEASRYPDVVQDIHRRGHEVASHSMTHRLPFAGLDDEALDVEVRQSKELLERLVGASVTGFRAPSWELSDRLWAAIGSAGYTYDASTYPSILLPLLRRSIARRGANGRTRTESSLWAGVFGPARPHVRALRDRSVAEIPVCTTPWTRLPYYHTLRFLLPGPAFACLGLLARTRRCAVTYQFHAVDFLETDVDGLDERIRRHPGMSLPLQAKLDLATRSLRELSARRQLVPLARVAETASAHTSRALRTRR